MVRPTPPNLLPPQKPESPSIEARSPGERFIFHMRPVVDVRPNNSYDP
jgi:hypothetical protein